MADETDNDTPDAEVEAQAGEEQARVDTQAGEEQAAGEQAEQVAADPPAAESAAAADVAPAADPSSAANASPPAEPAEQLSPKERRRRARSAHSGEARAARTPEERHAERVAERRAKAVRRRARRLQERAKAAERRKGAPAPEPLAPVHAPVEGARKVRQGVVVSDKADKTITVRVDVARRHRRYEKIVRSSGTLHAHDENNEAHEGDVVRVIESRPLSRTKRWKLVDVLERAR
jgi:small subunit ribosomal protein S17